MKVNALEKITINANTSDLGKIDLLVGRRILHYTNRIYKNRYEIIVR